MEITKLLLISSLFSMFSCENQLKKQSIPVEHPDTLLVQTKNTTDTIKKDTIIIQPSRVVKKDSISDSKKNIDEELKVVILGKVYFKKHKNDKLIPKTYRVIRYDSSYIYDIRNGEKILEPLIDGGPLSVPSE